VAYRGPGSDGFVKTISITADGLVGDAAIDTLEFDTSDGFEPEIIHVSGNTYAIAYRGPGSDGFVKTISIAATGQIGNSVIDTLEFDTSNGEEPAIVHISGNTYAVAYRGPGNDGFVKTISIAATGQIGNSVIDTEFGISDGYEPYILSLSNDIFAVVYRGDNDDGFLATITISAEGQIGNDVIDIFEFNPSNCYEPMMLNVAADVYAIVYRGVSSDGFLITIPVSANGQITETVIDTLEFDTSNGFEPRIIQVAGDIFAVTYRGANDDGFVKTAQIDANGEISDAALDTLEYDAANGYEPRIIKVSGNVFAIAYRSSGSNGSISTIEINSTTTYAIQSVAGGTTITALVRVADTNSTVLDWVIER